MQTIVLVDISESNVYGIYLKYITMHTYYSFICICNIAAYIQAYVLSICACCNLSSLDLHLLTNDCVFGLMPSIDMKYTPAAILTLEYVSI